MLETINYPNNYGASFLIASLALVISYIAIAQSREPSDHEKVIPQEPAPFWKDAGFILKKDRNFKWFLIVRALSQFASMGFGFYILLGLRRFDMSAVTAGYLTAALTITQTFANAGMGWLGDRVGHRVMLSFGAISAVISSVIAFYAASVDWLYPAFIMAAFANVAIWTISLTFTVDFGTESERPTYIGLANTLITPATILAPIIGGWLVDHLGFGSTFMISAIVAMLTAIILIFIIKDPRKPSQPNPLLQKEGMQGEVP